MSNIELDLERVRLTYAKPRLTDISPRVYELEEDPRKADHLIMDIYLYNQARDTHASDRMHHAIDRIHKAGYRPLFNKGLYISDIERRVENAGR